MASVAKEERGTLPNKGSWVKYSIRGKPRTEVLVEGTPKEGYYLYFHSGPNPPDFAFGWNKSRVKAENEARKFIQETKPENLWDDATEQAQVFADLIARIENPTKKARTVSLTKMHSGFLEPRRSEVNNIRMLSKVVEGYDAELKRGRRAAEAVYFSSGTIRQLDEVLKDATIGGMEGLFNMSIGEVRGYRTTDEEKEELQKLKESFETLRERAEQVNTCEHFFVPLSYFGGGFAPPSMDARCSKCESVLIVRHPATIARMLDADVEDLVKEDSGGGMYVSHFSKELVDRCKELKIPRDSDATPSLGGSIIDDLKLKGCANIEED